MDVFFLSDPKLFYVVNLKKNFHLKFVVITSLKHFNAFKISGIYFILYSVSQTTRIKYILNKRAKIETSFQG